METKSKTPQLSAEDLQLIADALEAIIAEDIAQTLREAK